MQQFHWSILFQTMIHPITYNRMNDSEVPQTPVCAAHGKRWNHVGSPQELKGQRNWFGRSVMQIMLCDLTHSVYRNCLSYVLIENGKGATLFLWPLFFTYDVCSTSKYDVSRHYFRLAKLIMQCYELYLASLYQYRSEYNQYARYFQENSKWIINGVLFCSI